MKNIFKSALSLTVAIGLTVGNTPFVWGISEQDTYVALGDSISTGRALEDIENNLFVNKIKKEYKLDLTNLAVDGMDTTAMLTLLNSNDEKGIAYKKAISDAELITISMGGNNLLQPLMEMMKKGLGLDANATGIELQEAMKKNPNALSILATSLQNPAITQSLHSKVELFAKEFPETIQEMLRVLGTDFSQKTVYIVGGETRISKEVAFVVGGNGEADAMSISAKAAQLKAPIVVVEKDKLSEEAKALLTNKDIYIIGGDSCVSEDVKLQLDKLDINKEAERVAGLDKLVDELAAAPLAAIKCSPILLTTEGLNQLQEESIKGLNNIDTLTRVGNGISENTINTIVDLLNQ